MGASTESTWNSGIVPYHEVTRPHPAAETLATRLRTARNHRAWSQQGLANRACTTQAVIQKIEKGKSLRPRNIVAIAKALEVGPSWLMFGASVSEDLSPEAIAVAKAWSELSEPERSSVRDSVMRLTQRF
ncbi:MAG: helix-turn-helix domain-containing protein [Gammaproteobacteria bacterium]|nr:helix-turn-helix domain-containing protein [Gammaproteobacteria bacterium]